MQVMIPRETSDFLRPIANGQMVTKVLKWDNHGYGASAQIFKIGSDIEICIYDKSAEMQQLMHLVTAVLETIDDRMLERTNERAEEFQVTTGVGCA